MPTGCVAKADDEDKEEELKEEVEKEVDEKVKRQMRCFAVVFVHQQVLGMEIKWYVTRCHKHHFGMIHRSITMIVI